jgi:hypothetical protein
VERLVDLGHLVAQPLVHVVAGTARNFVADVEGIAAVAALFAARFCVTELYLSAHAVVGVSS